MKRMFVLALLVVALGAKTTVGQQYAGTANQCLREYYDSNNYGWLTYENTCALDLHVVIVAISGRNIGSMDLGAGRHDGPGLTRGEVSAAGGVEAYACRAGYHPVDGNDNQIYARPVAQYRCKRS